MGSTLIEFEELVKQSRLRYEKNAELKRQLEKNRQKSLEIRAALQMAGNNLGEFKSVNQDIVRTRLRKSAEI